MIRDRFAYHAPTSVGEALAIRAETGSDAAIVSGGTWTVPDMTRGLVRPTHVIDLRRTGLRGIADENGHVRIGPATTYTQLAASADAPALLRTMAEGITGGPQVRNRGTIGGSACYANPPSDVPAALVALEATMRLASPHGTRDVAAQDFFVGARETVLADDELLVAILVPRPERDERHGYVKFKLSEGSWPIVTAACRLRPSGDVARLVVGGATATPVVVPDRQHDDASSAIAEPWDDVLAPGKYRKVIATTIARRAIEAARASDPGASQ